MNTPTRWLFMIAPAFLKWPVQGHVDRAGKAEMGLHDQAFLFRYTIASSWNIRASAARL